jgi:tRNA pseudouridine55 synthase
MISIKNPTEIKSGIIVVDKPSGWTSHDVVQKTKNILGGLKTGHTGTLDPFATGVMILLIGSATKSAKLFENDEKGYIAEITFGFSTDTFDCTGKVNETGDPEILNIEIINKALEKFKGEIEQIPPIYSAIKINGKRLYKLARAGKTAEIEPRKVNIKKIELIECKFPKIVLDIICSKGTYIRSIAENLGKVIGCPAHLSALRRTISGKYTISDAVDFISLTKMDDIIKLESFIKPIKI